MPDLVFAVAIGAIFIGSIRAVQDRFVDIAELGPAVAFEAGSVYLCLGEHDLRWGYVVFVTGMGFRGSMALFAAYIRLGMRQGKRFLGEIDVADQATTIVCHRPFCARQFGLGFRRFGTRRSGGRVGGRLGRRHDGQTEGGKERPEAIYHGDILLHLGMEWSHLLAV